MTRDSDRNNAGQGKREHGWVGLAICRYGNLVERLTVLPREANIITLLAKTRFDQCHHRDFKSKH